MTGNRPGGTDLPAIGTLPRGEPIQVFALPEGTPARPSVDRAEGLHIWDTNGRRYIDASSGPVACNLGHGNARVLAALNEQAARATFANPGAFESAANRALADRLSAAVGPGLERVFVVSGGSEAIESALKFARQWAVATGQDKRWKIISRQPSYHGGTLGAVAISGDESALAIWGPMVRPMPRVPAPFTYRIPDGRSPESWAEHCLAELERTIRAEGPESVLAFILEPVGGVATGALVAPDFYYAEARRICSEHGVLLIHDEIMCGAGRCGTFAAHHRWPDARPDILVLAKGVGAGYMPLGLTLVPDAMLRPVVAAGGFAHGHTAFGNPLACAVGLAVLEETLERDLTANAARMGEVLASGLDDLVERSPIVGDARGLGLLRAIELVADKKTTTPFPPEANVAARLVRLAAERGLLVYTRRTNGGRYGEWIMIAPPLIVDAGEIDEILGLLRESLAALSDEIR